ncbi:MAG: hypothetical protein QOC69_2340 [Mycobacterium sp.]|nr:hypothetical protein [Mycobacterium sp.]
MSGPQPPREGIVVTTRYSLMTWVFALVKPKVVVNGWEVPSVGWGRTVVPAPPGQYHVHVHTPYFVPSRVGPADYTVAVQPGRLVELEYKAPVWTFSQGSLGPPPQTYNGLTATVDRRSGGGGGGVRGHVPAGTRRDGLGS